MKIWNNDFYFILFLYYYYFIFFRNGLIDNRFGARMSRSSSKWQYLLRASSVCVDFTSIVRLSLLCINRHLYVSEPFHSCTRRVSWRSVHAVGSNIMDVLDVLNLGEIAQYFSKMAMFPVFDLAYYIVSILYLKYEPGKWNCCLEITTESCTRALFWSN